MLPLMFTLALNTAPLPADGTYTYVSSMNGATVARSQIVVNHENSGNVVLTENGSVSFNGQNGGVKDTLTLDAALAPSAYTVSGSMGDAFALTSNVAFTKNAAKQTGDVTKMYDLPTGEQHFVLLDYGPFSGYFALPAQMQAWSDAPVCAIVPMYARDIDIAVDPSVKPARPAGVPGADAQLSVSSPLQFTIWYDPKTLVVDEMDVPGESVTVTRTR